jgi:flagellar M-ring protein FliF
MAQLPNKLTSFTQPLQRLPKPVLYAGAGVVVLAVLAMAFASGVGNQDHYQYAFTNLGPEDSAEVAEHLKAAQIPFRLEAGGGAVSVPADKVYDARLLLAAVGLPRGGGVGFEIFDRGDIGVSEFTQRVNLQRAIEGELARTIGHLAEVRSARVHISLEEKSLFRDDQHKAAAAVVLNLQPGRSLDDRSIAGIRHLVASSVSGMSADAVTLVDGRGQALTTSPDENNSRQSADLEHVLEQRVVALLETVVGPGSVVAKVNATVDDSEVTTSSEVYDPDSAALRSEHKVSQGQSQDNTVQGGVAGAAANQPAVQLTTTAPAGSHSNSNNDDQLRNYELCKTVTHTVKH